MAKKLFPLLLMFFIMVPAYGVDLDEALPHYGPFMSPMVFPNGVFFIPIYIVGVDLDEALPHFGPLFLDPALPVDEDLDGADIFTPIALTVDPDGDFPNYEPVMVFGLLVDLDEALPDFAQDVDLDEALPDFLPVLKSCGPPAGIDESLPFYEQIAALFADPNFDILNIWLPMAPVDLDEALPHYEPPSCFSIDINKDLWFTYFSDGKYWAAPIEYVTLPHY